MFVKLTNIIAYIYDGEVICPDCYDGPDSGDVEEESPVFEADRDQMGDMFCPYCESNI